MDKSEQYPLEKAQAEAKEIVDALDRGEAGVGKRGYGYLRNKEDYVDAEKLVEGRSVEERNAILEKERLLKNFIEVLKHEFSITPWDLVETTIRSSFYAYGGHTESRWGGSANYDSDASLEVIADVDGSDPSNHTGEAVVKWHTTSGHYVELSFKPHDWTSESVEGSFDDWSISGVKIGNDESSSFYPTLRRITEVREIPVSVMEVSK